MRRIGVVTGARADYGILRPVLRAMTNTPALQLQLFVTGAHLAPEFGSSLEQIAADGFDTSDRMEMLLAGDSATATATSIGVGVTAFANRFARGRPDVLLLTGDRFEMLAAAVAALSFAIPLAHLHGGEISEGAIDEQIRHAITKMSHLHFASTPIAAARIAQMGEQAWRITVTGAPALDNLRCGGEMTREELEQRLGLRFVTDPLVVTFHPVTLQIDQVGSQIGELVATLQSVPRPLVITYPNADTANGTVTAALRQLAASRPDAVFVPNLGTRAYFSLLRIAAAMVGNSSSGIVEAPSFQLPVVNVGLRQGGRDRAPNVIDVDVDRRAIAAGIDRALSPAFRDSLRGLTNPYGDGHASERIVAVLEHVALNAALLVKRFEVPTH